MSPETAPDTDLTITVWLSADAQPRQWRLTCDPPANHPNPAAACAALARAPQALDPVAADRICAQVIFGLQRAEIEGRWHDQLVHERARALQPQCAAWRHSSPWYPGSPSNAAASSSAGNLGMSGVLFGATVLATATALPELSTGITSARMGDYQLVTGDIFGGNAFLPVLFLPATLIAGSAVLPAAGPSDIYLTALGGALTIVHIAGLIFRPKRQYARLGPDSIAVLLLYLVGIAGLVALQ